MTKQPKLVYLLIGLAAAAYLLSLALPGIVYDQNTDVTLRVGRVRFIDTGWDLLKDGLWGFLVGNFAWLANGLGITAFTFTFIRMPRISGTLSFAAFVISLDSLAFSKKPLDEGGVNNLYVDHFGQGFYVWEVSFILLLASQILAFRAERRQRLMTIIEPPT